MRIGKSMAVSVCRQDVACYGLEKDSDPCIADYYTTNDICWAYSLSTRG